MKKTLFRLSGQLLKYWKLLLFSFAAAVVSVICNLAAPSIIGSAIDKMTGKGNVKFQAIFGILIVLLATYLLSNLFLWLLTYLTNRISYRTVNDLRSLLFKKLGVLPLSFFDNHAHGDTVSRFVNDVDTVSDGLLQGVLALLSGVITIAGSIFFMIRINHGMTLVVILSAPAAFAVANVITRSSQRLFKEQARDLGELNGFAEEMIEGGKVVRAFNYQKRAMDKFKTINRELYRTGVKSQFISSLSNPSTRLVNNITYSVIGIIGGLEAVSGRITIGNISSFLIYSALFAKPFNDITNILTQLQAAIASAQRIFYILDLPPEPPEETKPAELKMCSGHVTFENVRFAYRADQTLIKEFNLDVRPGSSIAIVGQTGAGKTTLVNLLMRFYDVESGSIRIDGVDIRRMERDTLRRNFGMVLQDTWLFSGSIRDNIAYSRPEASLEEIIEAAKSAGAHSFIRRLSKGYDTVISDDGEDLSQGQRQLLAIARVMLADPPILILDEATSSIDTRTEMHIQQAFMKMIEGRTSFVIAHRLSTVRNADLILVMDNGRIVERGNHEDLLKKNGYYTRLYNSQFAVS